MATILTDSMTICDDCVMAIANDDYSGMDDAVEAEVRAGIERLSQAYDGWLVVGADLGFEHSDCDCCGQLPGNRHQLLVLGED